MWMPPRTWAAGAPGFGAGAVPGIAALAVLLLGLSAAAADLPFTKAATLDSGGNGSSILVVDLDVDGDLDVVSDNNAAPDLVWHQNLGGGSFAAPAFIVGTGAAFTGLIGADIDRDGDPDLVVGTGGAWQYVWRPNLGGGSFGAGRVIASGETLANGVAVGDLDGDGDPDVVGATRGTGNFRWFESDGVLPFPGWTAHTIGSGFAEPWAVALADLDEDGDMDVLGTDTAGALVLWFENDGTPGDGGWTTHTISNTATTAGSVHAADMDGDGDLDVVAAEAGTNAIRWHENDGTPGGLGDWTTTPISTSTTWFMARPLDMDGDGDMDVVSAGYQGVSGGEVGWHENTAGDGSTWTAHSQDTSISQAIDVYPGDLDGDGDPDFVFNSSFDGEVSWYRNDTIHRSAAFPLAAVITTAVDGLQRMSSGDVDGDGDLDLLAGSGKEDVLRWYENDAGDGSSWTQADIQTGDVLRSLLRDLDRDGDLDAVSVGVSGAGVDWHENTAGDGSAWASQSISTSNTSEFDVADLDGDGDLDVVVDHSSRSPEEIVWYENLGAGSFSATENAVASVSDGVGAVVAADMDGDGDSDVLVPWTNPDALSWYANDGAGGGWSSNAIPLGGFETDYAVVADLDGDGDADVAVLTGPDADVVWYENQGGGTSWAAPVVVDAASGSTGSLEAGDLDGDGDIDLASRSFAGVAWWENAGDGSSWTEHVVAFDSEGSFAIHLADLDGDGALDVVNSQNVLDTIRWFRNRGGQFALPTQDASQFGVVFQDTEEALLRIDADHRGRSGDSDVQVTSLELLFEESEGDPLSSTEANDLVETLRIYLDDGSGIFEAGSDTEIFSLGTLALSAGLQTLDVSLDADFLLAQGTPRKWFVVLDMAANASAQTPNTLRLTHLTESSSTAEDASASLPVRLEFAEHAPADVKALDPAADEDTDGLSNQVEVDTEGTDPFDADSDDDGVSDGDEVNTHLSNPLNADDDGDGWTDGAEVALGSDPTSAGSTPSYTSATVFSEVAVVGGSFDATEVLPSDVDRDGDTDLIATSQNPTNEVVWFENTAGDGSSWSKQLISATHRPDGVAADFDRDGDVDLAVRSFSNGVLRWIENAGAGVWNDTIIETKGFTGLQGISQGDVDGDGDEDIVLSTKAENSVEWYENDGGAPPTFTRHVVTTAAEAVDDVSAFDMDRDGDLDLLSISDTGTGEGFPGESTLFWYENTAGDGSAWATHTVATDFDNGRDVQAADVDGDGDPDVVAGIAANANKLVWYENTTGYATAWQGHVVTTAVSGTQELLVADLDRDGDVDVVVGDVSGVVLAWYENVSGDGSVWAPNDLGFSATVSRAVGVADIDGDGDLDVASADRDGSAVRWFRNDTIHRSGRFSASPVAFATSDGPEKIASGDFDGDGDGDLVTLAGDAGVVEWFENTAGDASSWGAAQTIDASAPNESSTSFATGGLSVADLDGDGDPDVLVASEGDDRTVWHENRLDEALGWTETLITSAVDDPAGVFAADIDGDGDLDPVVGSRSDVVAEVRWFENDGLDFSSSTVVVSAGQKRYDPAAADIDRDGDLDLVIVDSFNDNVSWYENDAGDGSSWTVQLIATTITNPQGLSLGDVDGDGDVDVSVCGSPGNRWYENRENESMSWVEHVVEATLAGCSETRLGDFDADGDLDIQTTRLFIGTGGTGVTFYENDAGDGTSWTRHDASTGVRSADAVVGDFDRDGDLDVATADRGNDELLFWANNGGQFAMPTAATAYQAMVESRAKDVLSIDYAHRGRTGDSGATLTSVELRLEDGGDSPLLDAEADALFSEIRLYADDGSGLFESGSDTSLGVASAPFSLVAGVLSITPSGGPETVSATGSRLLFAVPTLTATASSATPSQFQIVHLTESTATAQDAQAGVPLSLEFHADTGSGVVQALDPTGDADSDGLTNAAEADTHGTDPLNPDTDADGLSDGDEVNSYFTDPLEPDSDGDGLDDGTEVNTLGTDPLLADTDVDGFCDGPLSPGGCTAGDNCPVVSNGDQENSDSLSAGDACQCGDVDNSSVVDATDLLRLREHLVGRTLSGTFDADRCDVFDSGDDGSTDCDVADVAALERVVRGAATAIQDVCDAYLGP